MFQDDLDIFMFCMFYLPIIMFIALAAGILIYQLWKFLKKNSQDYDERQQLERGKAYRLAFIVLVVYETAYALLSQFMGEKLEALTGCSNFELAFTGVSLSIVVFVTYAICRDAWVRLCDYMDAHLYLWTYAAVISIALFVWNIVRGRTISLRDIWAVDVIVPLTALYIRRWRLKREEETE